MLGTSVQSLPAVFTGLWPSIIMVISTLVMLSVLVLVVTYFVYFPIKRHLDSRKRMIENNIKSAENLNKEAKKNFETSVLRQQNADKIIDEYIAETSKSAGNVAKEIISTATQKSQRLLDESRKVIELEQKEAKAKITSNLADLVVQVSEKVLAEKLDAKQDKKLIDELIAEVQQSK